MFTIHTDTDSYQMANGLLERNLIDLKKVLDRGMDREIAAVGKAIDAYESCMNTAAIDEAGIQPLRDLIDLTGKKFSTELQTTTCACMKYTETPYVTAVINTNRRYSCRF